MKNSRFAFTTILLLSATLACVARVNVAEIHRLPFDAHNFRQCQTLSTIELFYEQGIDVLQPRTNYKGEPGIFVLEFPLFQTIGASLYHVFGESAEVIRTFNILVTFASGIFVWLIARAAFGRSAAMIAFIIFITSPLNLAYMSAILLDPLAVLIGLSIFYLVLRAAQERPKHFGKHLLIGVLAAALSIVKALYLFPAIVLIAYDTLRKADRLKKTVSWFILFLPAGILFLVWNHHAAQINNQSLFSEGADPVAHLGFSFLLMPDWYVTMMKRLVGRCAGPIAGIVLVLGWIWLAVTTIKAKATSEYLRLQSVFLAASIGYWVVFANINFPHEYYSLIIVPFLAISLAGIVEHFLSQVSPALQKFRAEYLRTASVAFMAAASLLFFFTHPFFSEDSGTLLLQHELRGLLPRWSYTMIFLGENHYPTRDAGHDYPAALYALGVRGTSRIVADESDAVRLWQEYRSQYHHLRYLVMWGVKPWPLNLPNKNVFWDDGDELYVFELKEP